MLGKDLSEAMGILPDDMVEDAAGAYTHKRRGRNIWIRVAAMAATLAILLTAALWPRENENGIVTAPGILKVYAYDLTTGTEIENMVSYELTESVLTDTCAWTSIMNHLYGLPLTLEITDEAYSGMDVTFDVKVDYGSFYGDIHSAKYKTDENDVVASLKDVDFGKEFTIDNGETIFWSDYLLTKEVEVEVKEGEYLYFDDILESIGNTINVSVIIKADTYITGYMTLEIQYKEGWYTTVVKETVSFPMVDGHFQEVTMEDVHQVMERS